MAGLKAVSGEDIVFHGIGGPLMQAEGLTPLFPMEELSVMGLAAIWPITGGFWAGSRMPRARCRISDPMP
jgi:lipid A disaccharide synthetase